MSQFSDILQILGEAHQHEIDGKRCFVIGKEAWDTINEMLLVAGIPPMRDDRLVRLHSLENFEYRASALDQERYFVCCRAEPVLDLLWKAKGNYIDNSRK